MSTLDNTEGAAFVGMIVAAVLYGISCVQALYYYTSQNDPWYFKHTVTTVMVLDTIHQALISHTVYTYTITDWGEPEKLGLMVWSLVAEILFTGVVAFIVQSFLTMRIWRLSNRNIYITGISMTLITGALVTLSIAVSQLLKFKTLIEIGKTKGLSYSVNTLHAAADLLITGTLCVLLNTSRTGFDRSEVIINKLMLFTVNTGLITSLCATASLIFTLTNPNTFINLAFFFCLGRLYTNTLLGTLNARKSVLSSTTSVPLRDLSYTGSSTLAQNSISINIKTSTQEHHDQKLDEKPELPSDIESTLKVSY